MMMKKEIIMLPTKKKFIVQECGDQSEIRYVDNEKPYLQLRKQKRLTFEDNMPNTKTEMNQNLLTQAIGDNRRM